MRQIKKMMVRGLLDPDKEDPFSLFVASTNIRYCYYHDTHKILGNTFGMCVLQVDIASPLSDRFTCPSSTGADSNTLAMRSSNMIGASCSSAAVVHTFPPDVFKTFTNTKVT